MAILDRFKGKKIEVFITGLIDTLLMIKEFDFSDSKEKVTLFSDSNNSIFFNISKDSILSISDENKSTSIKLSNFTIKLSIV